MMEGRVVFLIMDPVNVVHRGLQRSNVLKGAGDYPIVNVDDGAQVFQAR